MTYPDWQEPVRLFRKAIGPASDALLCVAESIGCEHSSEPHAVLAAMIEDRLAPVLHGTEPPAATERQLTFLDHLGHTGVVDGISRTVASAWIDHYLSAQTAENLERLQLAAGDEVRLVDEYVDPRTGEVTDLGGPVTVSSIGSHGLVYLRGGNGRCAWPSKLRRT